eukprot:643769-Rhodomonas_salina.1
MSPTSTLPPIIFSYPCASTRKTFSRQHHRALRQASLRATRDGNSKRDQQVSALSEAPKRCADEVPTRKRKRKPRQGRTVLIDLTRHAGRLWVLVAWRPWIL